MRRNHSCIIRDFGGCGILPVRLKYQEHGGNFFLGSKEMNWKGIKWISPYWERDGADHSKLTKKKELVLLVKRQQKG